MIVSIASDHGGFKMKADLIEFLKSKNIQVIDNGTNSEESCDYPDFAHKTALDVATNKADYGVVVCTSGEGVCMTANKVKGVRCAIGYNDEVARLCRQHNNANCIAFAQKFMDIEDVKRRLEIFLTTSFEGGRHQRRVDKIESL